MGNYLPVTPREREEMLNTIGVSDINALFEDIPKELFAAPLKLDGGKTQQQVIERFDAIASKNKVFPVIMRGAGSYNHFIPPVVKSLAGRAEFLTAYTPYQAEMSQGILRAIFEYQTMILALTGHDAANASVYNGSTAAAEAVLMTIERNRTKVLVSSNVRPDSLKVIKTYAQNKDLAVEVIGDKDGLVDTEALTKALDDSTACFYMEQPSYFGLIEDAQKISGLVHGTNAKLIMGVNPIAMALLKSPAECGADIAVGEGQPLGLPMSFGGPYLGFMSCTQKEVRKLPGRIVGETVDKNGNTAYVLTLQAREQHIRREKASSNICSNQAHCALTAAIYMTVMGKEGLKETAGACASLAHYAASEWSKIKGCSLKYKGEFFHEFVTVTPKKAKAICRAFEKKGILAGLPLNDDEILWCMTELVKKDDIDLAGELIRRTL